MENHLSVVHGFRCPLGTHLSNEKKMDIHIDLISAILRTTYIGIMTDSANG